jgi:dTDP-glucose 4,6-dehydratase
MIGEERMAEERRIEDLTLLVTGGAGFIGSNFIHYMLGQYPRCKIINLDKLTYAGNLDNLKNVEKDPRYEFIHGDIRDRELARNIFKRVQGVVHFAAETHVDRSILDAGEFVLTDVYGTFVLLETLKNSDIEFFIHVSTDEVYGSKEEGYFKEDDLPIIILRPSNNFGPYQYPEKFIPLFVTNALEGKNLPLYGKGKNVRDWLYVEDNCRAIELVMRMGKIGEAYNVGANNEVQNITIAERIVDSLGKPKSLIKFVPDRLGHDKRYAVDCQKIHALGWMPEENFEEALASTVRWYQENTGWWQKIKEKSRDFKSFYEEYYRNRK